MRVTFDSAFPSDKLGGSTDDVIVFITDGGGFNAERRLTLQEQKKYDLATTFLSGITEGSHLLDASRINLSEFVEAHEALGCSGPDSVGFGGSSHHALEVNRRLSNYLSSFRLYLDFSEARLKRCYGRENAVVAAFKRLCARVFDESFAYRFCYKLRNFAQHLGMPIGHIQGHSALLPGTPELAVHSISVMFSAADLARAWPDGWGKVKVDLLAGPPLFDVLPVVRRAAADLARVHDGLAEIERPAMTAAANTVYGTLGGSFAEARRRVVGSYENNAGRWAINYTEPPLAVLSVYGFEATT